MVEVDKIGKSTYRDLELVVVDRQGKEQAVKRWFGLGDHVTHGRASGKLTNASSHFFTKSY